MMEITEIDAASFATRTAQVAAAELYGLLATGDPAPVQNWYEDGMPFTADDRVARSVELLGAYACVENRAAETLWRWAIAAGIAGRAPAEAFAAQSFAVRKAYDLFTSTARSIFLSIDGEQRLIEQQRALAAQQVKPLALEDSIFEGVEPMSAMRPESVEAEKLIAKGRAQRKKPAPATSTPAAAAPMTVGEAPIAAPANKGGRGRKKPPNR